MSTPDTALEKINSELICELKTLYSRPIGMTWDEASAITLSALRQVRDAAAEENERLREAIKWALGESGDFGTRPEGAGAYWWRKELRHRAAMIAGKGGRE